VYLLPVPDDGLLQYYSQNMYHTSDKKKSPIKHTG